MNLPRSFFFWCFIPGRGVVKAVCEPTTTDPETAEVAFAACDSDAAWMKRPIPYQPDIQRRLDEAASDALHTLCVGEPEGVAEQYSMTLAEAAEERHLSSRYTHPEDAALPAWQEC